MSIFVFTFSSLFILYCIAFFGCVYVVTQERENDPEEVEEREEEASASNLQKLKTTATKLFQLNQAIRQLHSSLSTTLRGEVSEALS